MVTNIWLLALGLLGILFCTVLFAVTILVITSLAKTLNEKERK